MDKRTGPRDAFSSLKWWQKALFGLAALVVFLTLLLLPRNFSVDLVASALASTFALSYLSVKGWRRILLIGLSSASLTALLLFTELAAPYGVVVVGAVALLLSFLTGWRDGGSPPVDRRA
jgi:hypothetical protein